MTNIKLVCYLGYSIYNIFHHCVSNNPLYIYTLELNSRNWMTVCVLRGMGPDDKARSIALLEDGSTFSEKNNKRDNIK